jgi:F-type H+-transporting ATPase subunit b
MLLELDWFTILFEIVNFLVLAALLHRFVFRPVMERVQKRAEDKERILREMEQDLQVAAEAREQVEQRLASIDEEAEVVLSQARENARQERRGLLEEGERQARQIERQAEADAKRLKRQTLADFHDNLRETILEVSGQVIHNVAPEGLHEAMVQAVNDRVWQMGQRDAERVDTIRRSLGERSPTAEVITARPLSSEQQAALVRTFTALADRNVGLDQRIDPDLYLGLRVRLGDVVTDHSIAGQLDALRERVDRLLETSRDALLRDETPEVPDEMGLAGQGTAAEGEDVDAGA